MAKVEGSSPFIRLSGSFRKTGLRLDVLDAEAPPEEQADAAD